MDALAHLAERAALVDPVLDALVPPATRPPAVLHAAMRHLLFPGGKRLRPALCMAAAEAVGGGPECALPAAAAVELVHTYSLIHDDLPCMDDDRERRGRPTVHVKFGEAVAVLAGDALLAAAFEALGTLAEERPREAALTSRDLAVAAGAGGLVGGQVDDLAFDPEAIDPGRVESVHARKSAALIVAAVAGGARLGGADEARVERLRGFARDVGVAFQITDDILDAGKDDACSLVRAIGIDAARKRAEALLDGALAVLEAFGDAADPLRELARFAVRRER